jgi:hypothetical protein
MFIHGDTKTIILMKTDVDNTFRCSIFNCALQGVLFFLIILRERRGGYLLTFKTDKMVCIIQSFVQEHVFVKMMDET